MKLEKLILVNWGALTQQEYAVGNMTLLTGQTGAGKSTWLDALQTVMTAAYQGIFSYNPGQDETSQGARNGKSKRSLWSYIVGAEDNLFARPDGAHGYVAAVFQPSEGEEGKAFTALVAAAARVEGSGRRRQALQERLALLIVDDAALQYADFIASDDRTSLGVVPVETIYHHLNARYPRVQNFHEVKKDYLCALYGRFRGAFRVSFPEAEQAARAWVQSIAYQPIGSVDELVKTQILEHDAHALGQRIGHISDLMRQVAQLRADGERLKANISRLEQVSAAAEDATSAYEESLVLQAAASKRALRDDDEQREKIEREVSELQQNIGTQRRTLESLQTEHSQKDASRIKLMAQLAGIPAAGQKQQCLERLALSERRARTVLESLIANLHAAQEVQRIASHIGGFDYPTSMSTLATAAQNVARAVGIAAGFDYAATERELRNLAVQDQLDGAQLRLYSRLFDHAQATHDAILRAISAADGSFIAALQAKLANIDVAIADAEERVTSAADRKALLAAGGADYPPPTKHTLAQLRAEFPACTPRVLCDLVEPTDTAWQEAIEAYMGNARFNIIVTAEWEARAVDLARRAHLGGKIVQGSLCLRHAKDVVLPPDSIVHELRTEHPVARAYLMDLYGRVVKVRDSEQLRFTHQGVTKDRRASGGRTMFVAAPVELVFGKEAKRLARVRAEEEHADAERELNRLREQQSTLRIMLGRAGKARALDFGAALELDSLGSSIESTRADLARLDLREVDEIEAQADALAEEIRAIDGQMGNINQTIGGLDVSIGKCHDELARLESQRPVKQQRHDQDCERLRHLCAVNSVLSLTGLIGRADELIAEARLTQADGHQRSNNSLNRAQVKYADVRVHLAEYNSNAHAEEKFDGLGAEEVRGDDFTLVYGEMVELLRKAREQLNAQRDIGLVKNLDQLHTAEDSFKDVFTKQFCAEIRGAVDTGVKSLRVLNQELERLKFGGDRFSIDWSEWVPEYKAYYDFFCAAYELGENKETLSLFETTELSVDDCKVRDKLVGLLLSNDQDHAIRELQRIADYRNYRRYEIWKESDNGAKVALSEWGTGSGGQLETPAYIVRAAVVTHRLKHFEKGCKLKLLVNDESFSKMDERRAYDVMGFMRDHLGLQLICAMPTLRAGALKAAFNKEWCFSRADAPEHGEIGFVSEPDERDLQPDRLTELWERRRAQVREQARIAFEDAERAV